jgi:hypothetical protein
MMVGRGQNENTQKKVALTLAGFKVQAFKASARLGCSISISDHNGKN